MATYYNDVGNGALVFTGYTAAAGSGCASITGTSAVAETVAVPHAPVKMVMKPATAAFCSSSVKARMTNNQSGGFWAGWSFAVPTAFTSARVVNATSLNANFKKSIGRKIWMDAYNSAGVVQSSVNIYSNATSPSTSVNSLAVNTTLGITVPASGFLVLRVDYVPSTQKGSGKGEIKWGATAATSGLKFITTEVPAGPPPPPTEIREIVNDSAGAAYTDGTVVHVYNVDGTLSSTGTVGTTFGDVIGHASVAAVPAGTGTVSVTFVNGDLAQRWIAVDPAVDTDGLSTNLITPIQLV